MKRPNCVTDGLKSKVVSPDLHLAFELRLWGFLGPASQPLLHPNPPHMGKVKDNIIGYLEPEEELVQNARRAVEYLERLQEEQDIDSDLLFDLEYAVIRFTSSKFIPF